MKNSFETLKQQSRSDFKVTLVDYGSEPEMALKVQDLCLEYDFVTYENRNTRLQPWNKSRALNSVIKKLTSGFCFVADVDILFHPRFVEKALRLEDLKKAVYFQVGFLPSGETGKSPDFSVHKEFRKSTAEATGLSMFPVNEFQKLRGFDEFYHFWGAEDTDMHVRLRNFGVEVEFYEAETLLLHQWHASYRSEERKQLTQELQVSGIVQLNHQHLKAAEERKLQAVNPVSWGECMTAAEEEELKQASIDLVLDNEKVKIDEFFFATLPSLKNRIIKLTIHKAKFQSSAKYKLKKAMGKKVPIYYTLKEINDLALLHLISFYRSNPYTFEVRKDLKEIILSLKT